MNSKCKNLFLYMQLVKFNQIENYEDILENNIRK